MLNLVKWVFWGVFWVLVAAIFHYTLPQNDVARVVDTYEKRVDFGENSIFWASPDAGAATDTINRDVFFISVVRNNGKPMIYRNEDTGWGWPPYFKFDTSNLQAEAADLVSSKDDPQWVVIKHYGWRNEFMSIFPNAVSVRTVDGPDASTGIPWLNIMILVVFFAIVWAIFVRWRRFRQARIDPVLEEWGDSLDAAGEAVSERRRRFRKWLDSRQE